MTTNTQAAPAGMNIADNKKKSSTLPRFLLYVFLIIFTLTYLMPFLALSSPPFVPRKTSALMAFGVFPLK